MVMMPFFRDTPRSGKQNLLEDGTVLPSKQQAPSSSFAYVLLKGLFIIVGLFVLFLAADCLANQVFAKDASDPKLFREMIGLQREEISLLRSIQQKRHDVDDTEFNQFESLIKELNITYDTQDKLDSRFQIFTSNLKRIELAQKANENTVFGVNHFTLMSDDELQPFVMPHTDLLLLLPKSENIQELSTPLPTRPPTVDWRTKHAVTRVKDQGKCESSWAFTLTATIEAARVIDGHPLEERSEQELIDCTTNHGCSVLFPDMAFQYLENEGVTVEKLYPYAGKQQTCHKIKDQRVKVQNWIAIFGNESKIADWVAAKSPVFTHTDCEKAVGLIYIAIVGYGTENKDDYWLVKSNWGTKFGDHGYIKIKRGVNSCGMGQWAMAKINGKHVSADPDAVPHKTKGFQNFDIISTYNIYVINCEHCICLQEYEISRTFLSFLSVMKVWMDIQRSGKQQFGV
uniref:Pept_C1 domain-containing protein n=1 Tax=Panagrellus redivivus TaxID=6233 RepID=A0A7E4V4V9_PANRE